MSRLCDIHRGGIRGAGALFIALCGLLGLLSPFAHGAEPGDPVTEAEAREFLARWLAAWESRDARAFCELYSAAFRRERMSRAQFCADKAAKFARSGPIRVTAEIEEVSSRPGGATLRFVQTYQSQHFHDRGRKSAELVREGGQVRILSEAFEALPWQPPPATPATPGAAAGAAASPHAAPAGSDPSGAKAPAAAGDIAEEAVPEEPTVSLLEVRIRQEGKNEIVEILLDRPTGMGVSPLGGEFRVTLLPAKNALRYPPEVRSRLVEGVTIEERPGEHPSVILGFLLADPYVSVGLPQRSGSVIRIALHLGD